MLGLQVCRIVFFFFNDTATTEIYTLSLHDALPICGDTMRWRIMLELAEPDGTPQRHEIGAGERPAAGHTAATLGLRLEEDRKSTRLNSSHANISYAVFCLKKKIKNLTVNSIIADIS